jgi:hypothetical protein
VALALALLLACAPGGQAGGVRQEGKPMQVREPAIAGSWYAGDAEGLRAQVSGFLARVEPREAASCRPLALVVPHAGLPYSGQVAAHAYRQLEGRPVDLVVLVGPSHRVYLSGCAVWSPGAWRTPLGLVTVDEPTASALTKQGPTVRRDCESHAAEHSIEIQLPFIQQVAPGARIVPVMMGQQDLTTARRLSQALVAALKNYPGRYVLVASSDLSHFHPSEAAERLDRVACGHLERLEAEGLLEDIAAGKCEACGGGPAAAVILAAKELGATGARLLKYAHSGDVTGDRSRVVGYGAVLICGAADNPGQPKEKPQAKPFAGAQSGVLAGLSEAERKYLHKLALASVECAARGEAAPKVAQAGQTEGLLAPCGAFVTLKRGGMLRGCIGNIIGSGPLCQTVAEMARAAATSDPRFPPLTAAELSGLAIEISVLTPLETVHDPSEVVIGRHGLFIVYGLHRGLLLPQVATEQGWDRQTFLEQTCVKAGLPPGAWKEPGAVLYRFGAEVF